MNNVGNSVNGLWEEITMNENNINVNATEVNNEWEDERATMSDEEWNFWIEEDRRRDEKNRKRDLERIREDLERIKADIDAKDNYEEEKHDMTPISFEESVTLAEQRQVEDDQILKSKADIDNYFMPADAETQVNPEEEITVENEDTTEELVVEETAEVETKEDSFDATPLIDKGNALIASTPSLFAYKEAIVLLRDVESAIDTIDSYVTRLSLESIKDGLMNLIAKYEADNDMSGTTNKKKQLADKVAGLKEVTAEKVSQAKAAIDNIDEDNEYYQKGVEVTEKAKEKYNKVLGSVFNRLKL